MRKTVSVIAILVMCLAALPAAQAEDYPPFQGIVADVAGVLSESAVSDLKALSQRLEDAAGGHVYVLTRHFLGGMPAQAYADKAFEIWNLGENDALLLMVIGEEAYALAMGEAVKASLPMKETRDKLLADHFRDAFLTDRDYDRAALDTARALAQAVAKAQNGELNLSGLFGTAEEQPQSTPRPKTWDEIWQGMFAQQEYYEEPWDWGGEWEVEERHVNWRGVLIWALVIYFLFFRKKRSRRR